MTSTRAMYRGAIWGSLIAALSAIAAGPAAAHVKWFCGAVDVATPPLELHSVLSLTPLVVGIGAMSLVAAGSFADSVIERRWPAALRKNQGEVVEELFVRAGLCFFLFMLWLNAGVAPGARHWIAPS
jgi:hypothetical protein